MNLIKDMMLLTNMVELYPIKWIKLLVLVNPTNLITLLSTNQIDTHYQNFF